MPADPKRVEVLFHHALELAPGQWPAFLAAECGGDEELRARVEQLLAAHAELARSHPPGPATATEHVQPTASFGAEPLTGTFDPARSTGIEGERPGDSPPTVPGHEIIGVLGEGGMGIVYKAVQAAVGRVVALKMIRGGLVSAGDRARFRAEAEAVAKLTHPGVVRVFEVGDVAGVPYFTLEFCDGGSLAAKLDGTPWHPAASARLTEMLADAVAAAHKQGIVHRDLKPANVLLARVAGPDGGTVTDPAARPLLYAALRTPHGAVPKVTDFGISKRLDSPDGPTATGAVMGTPSYMAPEQARGDSKGVGPAADVYALGAILYELLTGRPPFKAASVIETLDQVRGQEPVAPRSLSPSCPRDLETVCLKCLQKDPAKRYATAADLADDLRRFQEGRPVVARPVGTAERAWRWCRRNPAVAGLMAAVAVALVAGTAVSLAFAYESEQNAKDAREAQKDSDDNAALAQRNEGLAKTNESKARDEADLARHLAYVARVGRGGDALRSGNVAQVRAALEETRPKPGQPDGRGWEWHCLDNLVNRPVTRFRYHVPGQGRFYVPSLSPDGGRIALCQPWRGGDGPVSAGPRESGRLRVMDPAAPGRWVIDRKVEYDFNSGATALSVAAGLTVRVCGSDVQTFDLKTGAPVRKWKLEHPVAGNRLHVPQGIGGVEIPLPNCALDASGRLAVVLSGPPPEGDPDGLRQTAEVVEVWDASRATRVFRYTPEADVHLGPVLLGPGGKSLVALCMPAATRDDFRVTAPRDVPRRAARWEAWDVDAGKKLWQLDEPRGGPAWPAAFSPDGKRVYAVRGRQVFVRDAATGADVERLPLLPADVTALAVSADGLTVAAGDTTGAVSLIDATPDSPVERLQTHEGAVYALAFRADPATLVSASDDGFVQSYDLTRRSVRRLPPPAPGRRSDPASPNGRYALTRLRTGKGPFVPTVVERDTGRKVLSLPDRPEPGQEFHTFLAFTPDSGSFLTTVREAPPRPEKGDAFRRGPSSPLRLVKWGLASGRPEWAVVLPGPEAETEFVGFTTDGRSFLTLRQSRLVRRGVATGMAEWEVPLPPLGVAARKSRSGGGHHFSPDLSRLVYLVAPVVEYTPPGQAQGVVNTARLVAPAEIHAWNLSPDGTFTHRLSHTFTWHFAADETVIAEETEDELPRMLWLAGDRLVVANLWNAQVFDLTTGRASAVCRGEWIAPVAVREPLALTSDGLRLFGLSRREGNGYLSVWDTRTGEEVVRLPVPGSVGLDTAPRVVGGKVSVEMGHGASRYVIEFDGAPGAEAVKR
jgi:serine/threonine protein kinase